MSVSVLYREPKLLKWIVDMNDAGWRLDVSVLYREPKLLKSPISTQSGSRWVVSVLYREPKLLKSLVVKIVTEGSVRFSALP